MLRLDKRIALLPPLQLYRRILRSHRHYLPTELRVLGDTYVKAEFHRHQKITNPLHIVGFLSTWQSYCQEIEGEHWKDQKFNKELLESLNEQQISQLYQLLKAIREE
ncbi:ACN9 family protein [Schizosaccharomyces japonicus yFS275]|uniref:Succinate dehydrogenase assembly factor 3 n=1 Tax=Schizosaccharomyces japonicus (strain yFS275 / FY16936) TaxID=402676 RepID=B6K4L2_SCHJY|nr:ACN9 family protein [Schizosaccharomyces japonicus yFS275]EEB08419.1 ACN9 family protein [Schizosaccharomyces japonicus yFS275]